MRQIVLLSRTICDKAVEDLACIQRVACRWCQRWYLR